MPVVIKRTSGKEYVRKTITSANPIRQIQFLLQINSLSVSNNSAHRPSINKMKHFSHMLNKLPSLYQTRFPVPLLAFQNLFKVYPWLAFVRPRDRNRIKRMQTRRKRIPSYTIYSFFHCFPFYYSICYSPFPISFKRQLIFVLFSFTFNINVFVI